GVRRIASVFIVLSHLTPCFAEYIEWPARGKDGPIRLFQYPILRLLGEGQFFVSIFFVLLGFTNSISVIRLSNSGDFKKPSLRLPPVFLQPSWLGLSANLVRLMLETSMLVGGIEKHPAQAQAGVERSVI
ncbi:uncharacterized protein N7473_009981, partial [Penicillium subrubescens]|uniref:uncharacterized protein n=1 Tax=Penicillium subrubescens TaxID=1316194 RepID=UPI00254521E8